MSIDFGIHEFGIWGVHIGLISTYFFFQGYRERRKCPRHAGVPYETFVCYQEPAQYWRA